MISKTAVCMERVNPFSSPEQVLCVEQHKCDYHNQASYLQYTDSCNTRINGKLLLYYLLQTPKFITISLSPCNFKYTNYDDNTYNISV